ncbi:MAG: hypothetical protein N2109_11975 [Fimbriimonadales bacterium]|nr:hypothetical protein [Fimbriimonadales bacterium]
MAFSAGRLRAAVACLPEDHEVQPMAFHEWAAATLEFAGGFSQRLASEELQTAAMAEVCAELAEDSPFHGSRRFAGLHRSLCDALSELREWGVDAEALWEAAAEAAPALRSKLRALSEIERSFRELLTRLGYGVLSETLDDVESSELEPGQRLPPTVLLADADFTPRRARFVRWVVDNGGEVRVLLHRHPGGDVGFDGAKQWAEQLGAQARYLPTEAGWTEGLFLGHGAPGGPAARVWSAPDPLFEAEWVVRGCLADLAEGVPLSRVAIVARDLSGTMPFLEAAAARFGLPISVPATVPLVSNGFARLVLGVLDVCASRDVRSLLRLLSFRYGALGRTDRDAVRRAVEAAERSDAPWDRLAAWAEDHTDGAPWLVGLLRRRREAWLQPRTLAAWAGWLRELMDEGDWAVDDAGPPHLAARDRRAMRQLQATVSARAALDRAKRGQRTMDVESFRDLAVETWEAAESTVRDREDGVLVAARSADLPQIDSLYVTGMLEGQLPRRRSEDPILWDADRQFLRRALRLDPPLEDSRSRSRRERDEFVALCCSAARRLTLTYPQTDDDRDNVPAFYLREVERLASPEVRVFRRGELAGLGWPGGPEADRRMAEALAGPRRTLPEPRLLSPALRARLAWDGSSPVWIERLLDAGECPFLGFARHTLRLASGRSRAPRHALREVAVRAGMPKVAREVDGWTRLEDALAEVAREVEREEGPEFARALLAYGRRVLRRWLERERAAQELWPRSLLATDVSCGQQGTKGYIPLLDAEPAGRLDIELRLDSLWESGGVVGATMYGEGLQETVDRLPERDRNRLALLVVALFRRGASYHLEFEGFGSIRTAYALGRTLGERANDPDRGLQRRTMDGNDRHWVSRAQRLAARVRSSLQSLEIAPTPGEACTRCPFGELCRRSTRFPERDAFDGGE